MYGYAGHNNTAHNLYWTADFKLVYYLAALGIVYDPVTHTQQFYEVGGAGVGGRGAVGRRLEVVGL